MPKGSGLLSTPGDLIPPSRLVHASTLTYFADPVKTSDEAVNLAIHILNTVDIPHGVVSKDYTNWIVAKDLTYRGPCVRKLLTGLIMYIYPLKIKNIVLYCIVLYL